MLCKVRLRPVPFNPQFPYSLSTDILTPIIIVYLHAIPPHVLMFCIFLDFSTVSENNSVKDQHSWNYDWQRRWLDIMLKRTSFKVVLTYNMNVVICDDQRFFVNQLEGKLKNYSSRKDLNLRLLLGLSHSGTWHWWQSCQANAANNNSRTHSPAGCFLGFYKNRLSSTGTSKFPISWFRI